MFLKGGNQVINELVGEKHRKLNQFATLLHLLKHDRPMFWVVACLKWTKSGTIIVHFCTIFNVINTFTINMSTKSQFLQESFLGQTHPWVVPSGTSHLDFLGPNEL